jgi:hypothetical protein
MHESQHQSSADSNTSAVHSEISAAASAGDRGVRVPDDGVLMFPAFLACRTTLENLSDRTAALGENVSGSLIAAHLTGRSPVSDVTHNAVADAINARLGELSLPAAASYRHG